MFLGIAPRLVRYHRICYTTSMGKTIIFLDIDGVLNTGEGTPFSEEALASLKHLLDDTDADIVLHSGWKYLFDKGLVPITDEAHGLVEVLSNHGLRISDTTPNLASEDIIQSKMFSRIKAAEIKAYLADHLDVRYIILDDLDLGDPELSQHQIFVDPDRGLRYPI